jgi:hypothetical protein
MEDYTMNGPHLLSKGGQQSSCINHSSSFDQPVGQWNVSQVQRLTGIFGNTSFNRPLATWDVSRVQLLTMAFGLNKEFNQPIGNWNVSQVTDIVRDSANLCFISTFKRTAY